MKKCEYCAKEISYHEIYCCDDCQTNANKFYDTRDKISTLMGIINGVCVMSIGIGLFVFSFLRTVGGYMISIPLFILGILFLLFPMPADVMINKYKIEKSMKMTRIISIGMLVLGLVAFILTLFVF